MPGGHISDILYIITHNNRKVGYEVAAEFFYGWGHSSSGVENLWSVPGINIWGVVGSFPASVPASLVTPMINYTLAIARKEESSLHLI